MKMADTQPYSHAFTKSLSGRPLANGEFAFELYSATYDAETKQYVTGELMETVTNTATAFTFSTMEYSEVGTHYYVVKEKVGELGGITYDETEYVIEVKVTDGYDGKLYSSVAIINSNATVVAFNNTYTIHPDTFSFEAVKTLTGREMNAGEFSFELYETNSSYEDAKLVQTVKNDKAGKVEFAGLSKYPGTYYYVIKEVVGTKGGVSYDSSYYQVKIVIVDEGTTVYVNLAIATSVNNCISLAILVYASLVGTTVDNEFTFGNNCIAIVAAYSLDSTIAVDGESCVLLYNDNVGSGVVNLVHDAVTIEVENNVLAFLNHESRGDNEVLLEGNLATVLECVEYIVVDSLDIIVEAGNDSYGVVSCIGEDVAVDVGAVVTTNGNVGVNALVVYVVVVVVVEFHLNELFRIVHENVVHSEVFVASYGEFLGICGDRLGSVGESYGVACGTVHEVELGVEGYLNTGGSDGSTCCNSVSVVGSTHVHLCEGTIEVNVLVDAALNFERLYVCPESVILLYVCLLGVEGHLHILPSDGSHAGFVLCPEEDRVGVTVEETEVNGGGDRNGNFVFSLGFGDGLHEFVVALLVPEVDSIVEVTCGFAVTKGTGSHLGGVHSERNDGLTFEGTLGDEVVRTRSCHSCCSEGNQSQKELFHCV